jgi:hypothetical protein
MNAEVVQPSAAPDPATSTDSSTKVESVALNARRERNFNGNLKRLKAQFGYELPPEEIPMNPKIDEEDLELRIHIEVVGRNFVVARIPQQTITIAKGNVTGHKVPGMQFVHTILLKLVEQIHRSCMEFSNASRRLKTVATAPAAEDNKPPDSLFTLPTNVDAEAGAAAQKVSLEEDDD